MNTQADELREAALYALGQMLWPDPRVTPEQVREMAIEAYRDAGGRVPTVGQQVADLIDFFSDPKALDLRDTMALAILNENRRFSGLPGYATLDGLENHTWRDQRRQTRAAATGVATYLRANARSLAQHDDTAEAWVEKIIGLIEEAGR